MRRNKPRLAIRSLNESRRLHPMAYLALRYSLSASTVMKDKWAEEFAPEIVRRREGAAYLATKLFKQISVAGKLEFRDAYFPGGMETLAEAALLGACAAAGGDFIPHEEVYSYRLASSRSTDGFFEPYFSLYSARQTAIGKACKRWSGDVVLYADIKRFYPSITQGRALRAWSKACSRSKLPEAWVELGEILLKRQFALGVNLLVGPRLSHLIGNLILRDIDEYMRAEFRGRYFRYVDDIALVIPKGKIRSSLSLLRGQLNKKGLKLNRSKIFSLEAEIWKKEAPYQAPEYQEQPMADEGWMGLIDHLKCYLMVHPNNVGGIISIFRENDIRIPVPRYTAAIQEASYAERFSDRMHSAPFVGAVVNLTPLKIAREAMELREQYFKDFQIAIEAFNESKGMIQKWKLSRVRYLLGRLLLLATGAQLEEVFQTISEKEELREYREMFRSLIEGDVSDLVGYGSKICAVVGQALAARNETVKCSPSSWRAEVVEGYAALRLTGVRVKANPTETSFRKPVMRFVSEDVDLNSWISTRDLFFRELFALSGGGTLETHQELLQAPIDPDEEWSVFADDLLQFGFS